MTIEHVAFMREEAEIAEGDGMPLLARKYTAVADEIERLRDELAEMTQEAFCERASYCSDKNDDRYGWWDSCARSSMKYLGDRLVELGGWERDPDGHGRRWFYRPKSPTPETSDE